MNIVATAVVATAMITAAILVMVCVSAALSQKDHKETERYIA
jgi:hypothetical protein